MAAGFICTSAKAATLANPLITVNEAGNGSILFPGSSSASLPGVLAADPGPGGLASALTYNLLGPPGLIAGDVILTDPSTAQSDLIRFNPANADTGYAASLVFYSIAGGSFLADTGLPSGRYTNLLTFAEVTLPSGAIGLQYTPTSTQPGFVPGFAVSYDIISDVPEPGSLSFTVTAGVLLLAGRRWLDRRSILIVVRPSTDPRTPGTQSKLLIPRPIRICNQLVVISIPTTVSKGRNNSERPMTGHLLHMKSKSLLRESSLLPQ